MYILPFDHLNFGCKLNPIFPCCLLWKRPYRREKEWTLWAKITERFSEIICLIYSSLSDLWSVNYSETACVVFSALVTSFASILQSRNQCLVQVFSKRLSLARPFHVWVYFVPSKSTQAGRWKVLGQLIDSSASCSQPAGDTSKDESRRMSWVGLWNGPSTTFKEAELVLQVGDTSNRLWTRHGKGERWRGPRSISRFLQSLARDYEAFSWRLLRWAGWEEMTLREINFFDKICEIVQQIPCRVKRKKKVGSLWEVCRAHVMLSSRPVGVRVG